MNVMYAAAESGGMDFSSRGVRRITDDRNTENGAITLSFKKGDFVLAGRNSLSCKAASEKDPAIEINLTCNDGKSWDGCNPVKSLR